VPTCYNIVDRLAEAEIRVTGAILGYGDCISWLEIFTVRALASRKATEHHENRSSRHPQFTM